MQRVKSRVRWNVKAYAVQGLKYLGIFALMYICCIGKINNLVPFWFGLYVALMFQGINPYCASVSFLLAYYLKDLSVISLVESVNMIACVVVAYLIHVKLKKRQLLFIAGMGALVGSIAYVYFGMGDTASLISHLVSVLLGLIYTFSCMIIIRALVNRNWSMALNADEYVCMGVLLTGVICGLSYLSVFNIEISKIVCVIALLILSSLAPNLATPFGIVSGLGVALGTGSVAYMGCLGFMGLLASVFRTNSRIYSALSVLIVEVLFGLYFEAFGDYTIFHFISTAIGCVVYMVTPNRVFDAIKKNFETASNDVVKNIYNQNNLLLSRRLKQVSEVFYEMDVVFRQFVKGTLPVDEAKKMLSAELIAGCCEGCKDKNKCLHVYGEQMRECVSDIFDKGFEKGKINILDVPSFITSRCIKTNQFVGTANALINQYLQYRSNVNSLDSSKVLIADQLHGVSRILNNISDSMQQPISFDKSREEKLREELIYNDIMCHEIAVYEQGVDNLRVGVVVRDKDADNDSILRCVQSICKTKMMLDTATPAKTSGLVNMEFKRACDNEILIGLARANKNNQDISGDSHTITKISDSMYMIGICDGMGSGEQAEKTSNLTISLVENLYKAEYDNETILSSVNKLVSLDGEDKFATLDLCVINLRSGESDFIKLGCPECIIKQSDATTIIESGALPVGMLECATPKITKTVLTKGDMVVMFSDGIMDAFESIEELSNYVNHIDSLNPQSLADKILSRAISLDGGLPNDDMTVIVAKMF